MRSISEWFDKHMKTRIALQLVLDGLPFFVALAVIAPFTGILDGLSDYSAIYLFLGNVSGWLPLCKYPIVRICLLASAPCQGKN